MAGDIIAKVERYGGRYVIAVPDDIAARVGLRADDRVRLTRLEGAPALPDALREAAEASWAAASPAYRALARLPDPGPAAPAGEAPELAPGDAWTDSPGFYWPTLGDTLALHAFVMERLGRDPAAVRDAAALRGLLAAARAYLRICGDLAGAAVPLLVEPLVAGVWAAGNGPTALVLADTLFRLHGEGITDGYDHFAAHLTAIACAADAAARAARVAELVAWLEPQVSPERLEDDEAGPEPPAAPRRSPADGG